MVEHHALPQHVILEPAGVFGVAARRDHRGFAEHDARMVDRRLQARVFREFGAFRRQQAHLPGFALVVVAFADRTAQHIHIARAVRPCMRRRARRRDELRDDRGEPVRQRDVIAISARDVFVQAMLKPHVERVGEPVVLFERNHRDGGRGHVRVFDGEPHGHRGGQRIKVPLDVVGHRAVAHDHELRRRQRLLDRARLHGALELAKRVSAVHRHEQGERRQFACGLLVRLLHGSIVNHTQ